MRLNECCICISLFPAMDGFLLEKSAVVVEKIKLKNRGALILTGPSSCGKGEVSAFFSKALSIPTEHHLSMGEILRYSFHHARKDRDYENLLAERYQISADSNIFACVDSSRSLSSKVKRFMPGLVSHFGAKQAEQGISQLDWLEFCILNGLLVPDRWTQCFIEARLESSEAIRTSSFVLDGYPRTVAAARHLLDYFAKADITVIKLLHLSISKQEMLLRAKQRSREDDAGEALRSRYLFYVENVQPSVDFMKKEIGAGKTALIDAHQPVYKEANGRMEFDLRASIANVAMDALWSLGIPRVICQDLVRLHA